MHWFRSSKDHNVDALAAINRGRSLAGERGPDLIPIPPSPNTPLTSLEPPLTRLEANISTINYGELKFLL